MTSSVRCDAGPRNAAQCTRRPVQCRDAGALNLNMRATDPGGAAFSVEAESAVVSIACALVLAALALGGAAGFAIARMVAR